MKPACQFTFQISILILAMGVVGCETEPKLVPPIRVVSQDQSEEKLPSDGAAVATNRTTNEILDDLLKDDQDHGDPIKPADDVPPTNLDTEPDSTHPAPNQVEKADKPNSVPDVSVSQPATDEPVSDDEQSIEIPTTWKRLGKHEIWIDFKNKLVILGGNICLTAGQLEMFACPAGTKEHESVIAVNAAASEMHAALVALGSEPGKPCQWNPEYKPATGPVIDIEIRWRDPDTQAIVDRPARKMIQDFKTQQPMTQQWVFGGSEFWEDPESGEKIYYANSGEMICLSNFSTAALDLTVESSQSNDGLMFQAFTENIPPLGTKVYVILKPEKPVSVPPAAGEKKQAP